VTIKGPEIWRTFL